MEGGGGGGGGGGVDVSGVENVTLLKLQLITYKCTCIFVQSCSYIKKK